MKRLLLSLAALALVACGAAAGFMKGNPNDIARGLSDSTTTVVGVPLIGTVFPRVSATA